MNAMLREAVLYACLDAVLPFARICARDMNRGEPNPTSRKAQAAVTFAEACLAHRGAPSQGIARMVVEQQAYWDEAAAAAEPPS